MGHSSGYLGSLSQDPLGRIFYKCVFLNLLSPWASPNLQILWDPSKNLNIFQGVVHPSITSWKVPKTPVIDSIFPHLVDDQSDGLLVGVDKLEPEKQ